MPLYDFECSKCDKKYEVMVPLDKLKEELKCPKCNEKLERQFPAPRGIVVRW